MRYSFYQYFTETMNIFKLYIQEFNNCPVRCYVFTTPVNGISGEPGVTRLFGEEKVDPAGEYFLFPITFDNVEVGEFNLLEINEKFIKLDFLGSMLNGTWVIRYLADGRVLFWKPFPIVYTVPTRGFVVEQVEGDIIREVKQTLSVFQAEVKDRKFEGIALAEGIWTGGDLHTTLFSDKDVDHIYDEMKSNLSEMIVDYDHSFINDGKLNGISLGERRNTKFIELSGEGNKPIPFGSGLSLILNSELKWDTKLNVWTLLSVKPLGVSVITQGSPACTICMIR